jgi:hypothetical protein
VKTILSTAFCVPESAARYDAFPMCNATLQTGQRREKGKSVSGQCCGEPRQPLQA